MPDQPITKGQLLTTYRQLYPAFTKTPDDALVQTILNQYPNLRSRYVGEGTGLDAQAPPPGVSQAPAGPAPMQPLSGMLNPTPNPQGPALQLPSNPGASQGPMQTPVAPPNLAAPPPSGGQPPPFPDISRMLTPNAMPGQGIPVGGPTPAGPPPDAPPPGVGIPSPQSAQMPVTQSAIANLLQSLNGPQHNVFLPSTGFFGNHPNLSSAIEHGLTTAAITPTAPTIGGNIAGVAQALLHTPVAYRQMQTAPALQRFQELGPAMQEEAAQAKMGQLQFDSLVKLLGVQAATTTANAAEKRANDAANRGESIGSGGLRNADGTVTPPAARPAVTPPYIPRGAAVPDGKGGYDIPSPVTTPSKLLTPEEEAQRIRIAAANKVDPTQVLTAPGADGKPQFFKVDKTTNAVTPLGMGPVVKPDVPVAVKGNVSVADRALKQTAIVRQILKEHPEMVGPFMGRMSEFAQGVGSNPFAGNPQLERLGATLSGHLRYLFAQELKNAIGARPGEYLAQELKDASPQRKQDINILMGALDSVDNNAHITMKSAAEQGYDPFNIGANQPAGAATSSGEDLSKVPTADLLKRITGGQ